VNLYPLNWSEIAYRIKQLRNWTCQECGRHPPDYLAKHISVHHLDHNTFNNEHSNLLVLCADHHFAYERLHRLYLRRKRKLCELQASGQQVLAGFNPYPYN